MIYVLESSFFAFFTAFTRNSSFVASSPFTSWIVSPGLQPNFRLFTEVIVRSSTQSSSSS